MMKSSETTNNVMKNVSVGLNECLQIKKELDAILKTVNQQNNEYEDQLMEAQRMLRGKLLLLVTGYFLLSPFYMLWF